MDGKNLVIRVNFNDQPVSTTSANASGNSDVWGWTLGPLFAAGKWTYQITDIGGNVLAIGSVTAQ